MKYVGTSPSCDTWVALKDSTSDGSVILAKNSDRPPMEAQPLVQMPRHDFGRGDAVKCTFLEIPQVAITYAHVGSKIWWTFGYEHGMNEHGVAIGNEAVWSKEPYEDAAGLIGMDLVRLGLERARTAYEAMHVMVQLIHVHGQSGQCEWPGQWGNARNFNSFIIADPNEAWILETAGRYWVAKRLTRGVYSISNVYSIEQDWDEAHPGLVDHAIAAGWTTSREDFNFARDYGDYWRHGSNDPGMMQVRRNATLNCLRLDHGSLTPAHMMKICRNHHEGTLLEPRWGAAESFWAMPCMHDSTKAPYHTAASMIAHLRNSMPTELRQVYWGCFSNPCSSVFQPFYLHGARVPASYSEGTGIYSDESPWWRANRVKLLCHLNFRALQPKVRVVFDAVEEWEMRQLELVEAEVMGLVNSGDKAAAARLLRRYVDDSSDRIAQEYSCLIPRLTDSLREEGIQYLHLDYLKDWTSKCSVPLPIP
ncbi:MAG: C69 family dipeptidase [Proteobacteria bacterium]|nr:C69 family dipeptidase [Pseudomonadota bacterium]